MDEEDRVVAVAKATAEAIMGQYPDGHISNKDEALLVIALCKLIAEFASARRIDPGLVLLTMIKALCEAGAEIESVPMVQDNGKVH